MPTPRTVTETLNRIETTPASNDPHRLRFYLSTPVKVIRFKVGLNLHRKLFRFPGVDMTYSSI